MADDRGNDNMTKDIEKLKQLQFKDDDNNEGQSEEENELIEDPDDVSPEEFQALNSRMDQLNSALDALEEQNDIIHAKLIDLLESNRAARKQFQEEQEQNANKEPKRS